LNIRYVIHWLGKILLLEALFFLLPLTVSFLYKEDLLGSWFLCVLIVLVVGTLLTRVKPLSEAMYAREGLSLTALSWIFLSIFGALPFLLTGTIPSFTDAFFETVSGFTTTGASILLEVESLPHSILFWRSFTHFIGGMGVLVFALAIMPRVNRRSIHVLRAESPGPEVGKLVNRLGNTARILYKMYMALTVVQIVLLLAGGMPFFDSVLIAFGSAGTGGFGIKNTSMAYYNSPYLDMVVGTFIILFGVNFNMYYFLLMRETKLVYKNDELRVYLGIIVVATIAIALSIAPMYAQDWKAWLDSYFQVASIITTTGYTTADFNTWPAFARAMLLLLMFIGASAGSTGGGFKVSRVVILWKGGVEALRRSIQPNRVKPPLIGSKPIPDSLMKSVGLYLFVYLLIFVVAVLLLSLDDLDLITSFSAVAATFNNIGPGLGAVGPMENFGHLSPWAKHLLSLCMLLGRLEIFPILVLFVPQNWRRN